MGYSAHHVRGRIRYKIPGLRDSETLAHDIHRALQELDGIRRVEIRPSSNSLIVHYDPDRIDDEQVAAHLGTRSRREARPHPVDRILSDDALTGNLSHYGAVFGRAAFKVALQQAVTGGLNSIVRTALVRG